VGELVEKQGRILAAASRLLKPGGRLVYATCSLLADENEAVAAAFGAAHPEFQPFPVRKCSKASALPRYREYLKLSPHRHGTDAFFAAAFERASSELWLKSSLSTQRLGDADTADRHSRRMARATQ
jgi:16S rRNA (cytosine967-C5)-methyltransferase